MERNFLSAFVQKNAGALNRASGQSCCGKPSVRCLFGLGEHLDILEPASAGLASIGRTSLIISIISII